MASLGKCCAVIRSTLFAIICTNIFVTTLAVNIGRDDPHEPLDQTHLPGNHANLLLRLEATEKLVQQLLVRVEYLEAHEKGQEIENQNLHKQLSVQRRRTSMLEKLVRRHFSRNMSVAVHAKNDVTDDDNSNDNRIQDEVRDSKGRVNGCNRIRREENRSPVAFFAALTKRVIHAGINQTYVFDKALTNIGNAYNNHSGNFIVPVDGTYVFSVTLMSQYHVDAHAQYFKNGQAVSNLRVSGAEGGYDSPSQTIILQLSRGDAISVHNVEFDVSMTGLYYSTFAGFLLYERFSSPVVVGRK